MIIMIIVVFFNDKCIFVTIGFDFYAQVFFYVESISFSYTNEELYDTSFFRIFKCLKTYP